MSFLAPLFLVGTRRAAVPVLLHLIQRERRNVVQFPSLMFLRRIPYQSVRRRRIRHWLLLAMRLAALTLIVLAFARPFLRRAGDSRGRPARAKWSFCSIGRTAWATAIAGSARCRGPRRDQRPGAVGSWVDRALRIGRGGRAPFDVGSRTAHAAVVGVQPGAGGTRYGPALKLAGSILERVAAAAPRGDPDHGFSARRLAGRRGRPAAGRRELTTKPVGDAETANLSVTPITLQRSTFSNQERVLVTGGVVNHGSAPVNGAELALEIGGRAIQTQRVNLEANGSASVTFEPVTLTERNVRASVRAPNDALARDNVFNFVISPEDRSASSSPSEPARRGTSACSCCARSRSASHRGSS